MSLDPHHSRGLSCKCHHSAGPRRVAEPERLGDLLDMEVKGSA